MNDFEVYKKSGVDVEKGNDFVRQIKPLVQKTYRKEVLGHLGAFAGFFEPDLSSYQKPVLVSATDGVGTKLFVAQKANDYKNIGIDLVAMCVNDIVVHGAEPLFFLDYMAMGSLDTAVTHEILEGVVQGCLLAGTSLVGGETAEMPSFYGNKNFDIAGFCVGVVEKEKIILGKNIVGGDVLLGIPSSGLHSNGYSLIRKIIFEDNALDCDSVLFDGISVKQELLKPTKIYVKIIQNILKHIDIKGMVHITGGGFHENIPRILPQNLEFRLKKNSWPYLAIFEYIQRQKNISNLEMEHIFNCGIGMVLILSRDDLKKTQDLIASYNENSYWIGDIVQG